MNRRNFLKAAALLTPVSALATELTIIPIQANEIGFGVDNLYKDFNPSGVYGNHIYFTDEFSSMTYYRQEQFFSVLTMNMAETIPQEYWGKVKFGVWNPSYFEGTGDYYDEIPAIYWKYSGI